MSHRCWSCTETLVQNLSESVSWAPKRKLAGRVLYFSMGSFDCLFQSHKIYSNAFFVAVAFNIILLTCLRLNKILYYTLCILASPSQVSIIESKFEIFRFFKNFGKAELWRTCTYEYMFLVWRIIILKDLTINRIFIRIYFSAYFQSLILLQFFEF